MISEDLSTERGHRTLAIVRKGGKHVTIPIAPRTGRALDLYIGERTMGPIFLGVEGGRVDRYRADWMVKRLVKRSLRHSSPPRSMPASHCATSKKQRRTPTHERRCATTVRDAASTGTPPTSCRHSSPEQPDRPERHPPQQQAIPSDRDARNAGYVFLEGVIESGIIKRRSDCKRRSSGSVTCSGHE